MHKTLLATVSIAAIGISTAMAADLGAMPTKAPNFVAPSWTGFYAGLNAGYAWGNSEGTAVANDRFSPALGWGSMAIPSLKPQGFIGGGQIGYNWQSGSWVLGAEADFSGMNAKTDGSVNPFFSGKAGSFATYSSKYDWLATARLRAGVTLAPNWLVYVTGGLAVTRVSDSILGEPHGAGPTDVISFADSKTLVGGTVGAGVEYAFAQNWSVKAEYLYAKFDDTTPTLEALANFGAVGPIATFKHDLSTLKGGINYRF
jgi:outer membrane immunogenic protein